MSAASVQHRPAFSRSFQFDDYNNAEHLEPAVLCIEELRAQLYSCITCGVSWLEDHVCLDCAECGGYSLQRPCPLCDGRCASYWKRDLAMSHACGKARWTGTCQLQSSNSSESTTPEVPSKQETSSSELNRSFARI